ncbi:MAG: GTPase HflX, partial [Planctomycetes bacterium]|nr:GTPase HflX [Planctomycetota bacterium]
MEQDSAPIKRATAVLFGIVPPGDSRPAEVSLAELERLADTCGLDTCARLTQQRRSADPNSYLGLGKLTELRELIEAHGASAAICNDTMSPTQSRRVEQALKIDTIDRSELILNIFGTHAKTPQAKLQVELASLEYQLPRLKRLWTHLERQRGGIGLRGGAGEKQIDLDRSDLRNRIAQIQRKLNTIERRKSRMVASRRHQFRIALVGYTNAGKSTLLNALTDAGVLAQDRLFSTLDTSTRPWRLRGGRTVLVSDTVGFIQDLPHQLIASFHATLEEALAADLLLVLVDGSDPAALEQVRTVEGVLDELGAQQIPRLYVLNKTDALQDQSALAPLYHHAPHAVAISARTRKGLEDLEGALLNHLATCEETVDILVPHDAGSLRAEIRQATTVLAEVYTEEGALMT